MSSRSTARICGAVAYRMLGSVPEAEDAVQEAWLRMDRADVSDVRNMRGWLTTVVARICLDMLRARSARPEQPLDETVAGRAHRRPPKPVDPEQEALLADSVGAALLVILQRLSPAERLAFVLHDMFDLPFAEIAPIVGRSENTAAQLAARARRRVRGKTPDPATDLVRQRRLVDAFLAAARDGDFDSLLAALDADVVLRVDAAAAGTRNDDPRRAGGRRQRAAPSRPMPASPSPRWWTARSGSSSRPKGRLALVLRFGVVGDKITEIDIEADPDRLRGLDLAVLD